MIRFKFSAWRAFKAQKDNAVVHKYLRAVAGRSKQVFAAGMQGRHTGLIYYRKRGIHQASAPGEYPANDTGSLLASAKEHVTSDTATFGTNMYYAKFLREGTRFMARRKMSDDAIHTAAQQERGKLKGWVQWARSR